MTKHIVFFNVMHRIRNNLGQWNYQDRHYGGCSDWKEGRKIFGKNVGIYTSPLHTVTTIWWNVSYLNCGKSL